MYPLLLRAAAVFRNPSPYQCPRLQAPIEKLELLPVSSLPIAEIFLTAMEVLPKFVTRVLSRYMSLHLLR
jgi:hypothetical protein